MADDARQPAKWQNKFIPDLTDVELLDAFKLLSGMVQEWEDKKKDPRYIKKFKGQPPTTLNPSFKAILDEVNEQIANHKITPKEE